MRPSFTDLELLKTFLVVYEHCSQEPSLYKYNLMSESAGGSNLLYPRMDLSKPEKTL